MEKKVSASLVMMLWCVLHALIIDASQKVHVPEIDCSAEANLLFCVCIPANSHALGVSLTPAG